MHTVFTAFALMLIMATTPSFAGEKPAKPPKDLTNYIAIFDFDVVGKVDKDISRPLSDSVRHEIVKSGKFKVMDRANMDRILREQAFQMTGGVPKDKAVEAGQFLGVGKIVIGSIGIVGRTYMISLSLVNIESGETERVEEDTCKCELDELIESVKRTSNKLMVGGPATAYEPAPVASPGLALARVESVPQTAPVQRVLPSGVTFREPVTGMEFVLVRNGCFQMGDKDGRKEERIVHEVCLDSFYMGKYEVTQGQWKMIQGKNPAKNRKSDMHPVEDVSWEDVQDFIRELSLKTGQPFRLPTEAEWEYAARSGGQRERWAGTNDESDLNAYAWWGKNAKETHPVGQKKPNGLGLYDMTGNVREWVSDRYDSGYYNESPRNNPTGPERGSYRVYRGGSYDDTGDDRYTTYRDKKSNSRSDSRLGFRLALPAR